MVRVSGPLETRQCLEGTKEEIGLVRKLREMAGGGVGDRMKKAASQLGKLAAGDSIRGSEDHARSELTAMTVRYRIVTDAYLGYEVQQRPRWWPFWSQIGINTHATIEEARMFALRRAATDRKRKQPRRVVEEVKVPNADFRDPAT